MYRKKFNVMHSSLRLIVELFLNFHVKYLVKIGTKLHFSSARIP